LNDEQAELILNASPMHDIGKIGIPDNVLLKPGKLTNEEFDIIKQHPEYGVMIMGEHSSELLKLANDAANSHHEKWNGRGYPNGTKGEDIPLIGRIAAVADVFDALTSERPYKKAWTIEDAVGLIERESGEQFDPRIVKAFVNVLPEILKVKEQYAD
jgi:putative two-component system response regulator